MSKIKITESDGPGVTWIKASVMAQTGPAFMPDDILRCKSVLREVEQLTQQRDELAASVG